MATAAIGASPAAADRLEVAGYAGVLAFAAALQLSIAAAQILLALTLALWVVWLVARRERIETPRIVVPLAAYAAATLISAAFSRDPRASFIDCKQLSLFLLVPMLYRFARGSRAGMVLQVIISVGAASAAFGIVQYGVLEYDNLGRRPQGALGHYMTYSGLLVLVTCAAAARVLYSRDRTWPALMMPALLAALALTFTRSAWVGACVSIALLLSLKDLRLTAVLPVAAALLFALAPARVTDRVYSMFDLRDPTSRERIVMLKEGARMVAARPLTGLGPNMIERERSEYRSPAEPDPDNPHLHNVPMQIAAERGLPALGIWIWFLVTLGIDLARQMRTSGERYVPAAGIAAMAAMLTAGMFEYNFGDSEFLMLFLVLVTLPYAAARGRADAPATRP
jgi:O-antigen ligase